MPSSSDNRIISAHWRGLGIDRLLTAPLDLQLSGARVFPDAGDDRHPVRHVALFNRYLRDLQEVIPEARRVWLAIIAQTQKTIPDRDDAMIEALRFQPAGAAF